LAAGCSFLQASANSPRQYVLRCKKINGHQCTLTAWESREQMLNFMRSGVHLKAMKAFDSIATGKTYGYETNTIPGWDQAFALLQEKGRVY